MTWVLWDILIPLLLSFGLGTLLSWQIWRSHGHLLPGIGSNKKTDPSKQRESSSKASAEPLEKAATDVDNSSALSELEAANITLIGERDYANQSSEESHKALQLLKVRNEELEAELLEHEQLVAEANDADSAGDPIDVLNAPIQLVDADNTDSESLERLQQNFEDLKQSLESERREKRELELQLLNTNNKCEKLEAKIDARLQTDSAQVIVATESEWKTKYEDSQQRSESLQVELEELSKQVSAYDNKAQTTVLSSTHFADIAKRDLEIQNLTATVYSLKNSAAVGIETVATDQHRQEIQSRDVQIEDLKRKLNSVENDASKLQSNDEITALNNSEEASTAVTVQTTVEQSRQKPSASGYVPVGWSVPENLPSKKERDQLTDIKGVGPVLEKMLHKSGIHFFSQIALLDKGGIDELQEQIPQFPGRIQRDGWVKQASKLHRGKYGSTAKN